METFLLSNSLVRSLRSLSASARKTVCCKRPRSLVKSAMGSDGRTGGEDTAIPCTSRAMVLPFSGVLPCVGVGREMSSLSCQREVAWGKCGASLTCGFVVKWAGSGKCQVEGAAKWTQG